MAHAMHAVDSNTTMSMMTMMANHSMVTGSGTTMNHNGHNMDGTTGGHNHGGMDMNNTDRTCAGDMLMYFHTGKCEYILFEDLRTANSGGMIGACAAIFFLAIFYEGLKVLREHLLQRSMVAANKYAVSQSQSQETMVISNQNVGVKTIPGQAGADDCVHMMSGGHFLQTLLHMIQVFISYCLMLVFMTYNVWLCLAVIVGAGFGYFLFGWRKAIVVDINEHCH